ncbi:ly6/PLAUR domain-containing protein 6B-like [Lineus longissimus]|uniref:ly6/PLAUR domain-containing protein 6B-like n=1 Tax=Lineus longissimus TaxID=88925 RepID=UPI00315DA580
MDFSWISVWLQLAVGAVVISGLNALKCFTCENENSNYYCMSDYDVKECEQGYDTCQTIVSYLDSSEKLSISKTCSKNTSCYMQMNATVDKYPCDTDYGNWICTTCCHEDGCNKSGAWSACARKMELVLSVLVIVLLTASYTS